MPSSTVSCTPLTASHSTARPCANQRKKPASGASLTPTTPSEPLNPSTGELSAIIGMLSAIDRNQCPQSIGTPVRNPRNLHLFVRQRLFPYLLDRRPRLLGSIENRQRIWWWWGQEFVKFKVLIVGADEAA